jgi:hypothetical protein
VPATASKNAFHSRGGSPGTSRAVTVTGATGNSVPAAATVTAIGTSGTSHRVAVPGSVADVSVRPSPPAAWTDQEPGGVTPRSQPIRSRFSTCSVRGALGV